MSRIGRQPVAVPAGVTVDIKEGNVVAVKGPKGNCGEGSSRGDEHQTGGRPGSCYKTQRSERK